MKKCLNSVKEFFATMDEERTLTKRELFLAITTCTLAGVLLGILLSPRKNTMIGSNNGNGSNNGTAPANSGAKQDSDDLWEDGEFWEDDEQ